MKFEAIISLNAIYLLTVLPLFLVIYIVFRFMLKVTAWYMTDILTLILPGVVYALLYTVRLHKYIGYHKSLGNLVELIILGIACALLFLIRSFVGKKYPNHSKKISVMAMFVAIIVTLGLYIMMPGLTE